MQTIRRRRSTLARATRWSVRAPCQSSRNPCLTPPRQTSPPHARSSHSTRASQTSALGTLSSVSNDQILESLRGLIQHRCIRPTTIVGVWQHPSTLLLQVARRREMEVCLPPDTVQSQLNTTRTSTHSRDYQMLLHDKLRHFLTPMVVPSNRTAAGPYKATLSTL
jgi:hypothetical protein